MTANAVARLVALLLLAVGLAAGAPVPPVSVPWKVKEKLLAPGYIPRLEELHESPASDTLDRLSKHHGLTITLDAAAFERAGLRTPLKAPLPECMRYEGCLFRLLRRIASGLHPAGVLEVRGDTVFLTTAMELKSRGREPARFPVTERSRKEVLRTQAKLDALIDIDFSDVDQKDARLGPLLDVVARRYKVVIDVREEVFALHGKSAAQFEVVIQRLPADRGPLKGCLEKLIRSLKDWRDDVILMVGDDGAVVITTKKYKDDPIPSVAKKPVD